MRATVYENGVDITTEAPQPRVNLVQKTMAWLRIRGYTAEVVESWNQFGMVKHDLFGFADVLAFDKRGVWLIQVTSLGHGATRKRKILASREARKWMMYGYPIHIHEWKGVPQPSGRRKWVNKITKVNDEPEVQEQRKNFLESEEMPF